MDNKLCCYSFFMTNFIILKIAFILLRNTTLPCPSLWTLIKESFSLMLESQVSNTNDMKANLLSEHFFFKVWPLYLKRFWELSTPQVDKPQSSPYMHVFHITAYPTIHQNMCWHKCRSCILRISQEIHNASFFTNTHVYSNISNNTSFRKSGRYLNPESSLKWICVFPKCIQICVTTDRANLIKEIRKSWGDI